MPWPNDPNQTPDPKKKNPWGQNADSNKPNNPYGGGQRPDDIDEMLKKARANFEEIFPGGGNLGGKIWAYGLAALLALYLLSGFYIIQPNENAVILTFGEYSRTEEQPGLKYRAPWPFQSVVVLDVTSERRIEIGFRDINNRTREAAQDVADESLMLTGDENIIDIDFVVLWRVGNAREYLFEIRNPDDTIKIVAESAIREIIGRTNIQPALTDARNKIQSDTRALMQHILDDYKAGVIINNIQLQKVDPPAQVVDAFNEVQRARQQKEELRNKAEAYRNDIIPRARGEAEKLRQEAEAYKQEVVNRATGDAARFDSVYEAYLSGKSVTSERMYLETVEQVLQNAKTIVMGSDKSVVPYLPMNDLTRKSTPLAEKGNAQ